MTSIPKTKEEQDEFILSYLISEELREEYDEVKNSALEVAKEMDALAVKINDAKSKIEEIDQNEDSTIVITDHWDRKICKVQLEDWAGEYISLLESLNFLSAEQHALFIQMKNCVNVGLNDLKSMIARNKGEEPKIYKGLSVVEVNAH